MKSKKIYWQYIWRDDTWEPHVLASWLISIMSELSNEVGASSEPWTSESQRHPSATHCWVQRAMTWLAPAQWFHTMTRAVSRYWAKTALCWADYTWHWHIYIILYGGAKGTCLCALAAGWIQIMSMLLHEVVSVMDRGPYNLRYTYLPPIAVTSMLTNRP